MIFATESDITMEIVQKFAQKKPSVLRHHQEKCCEEAWAWLRGMDMSLRARHEPPTWIRDKFDWGPSTWPVYWCEVPKADSIDCGVFAAIARALLFSRNAPIAAVQLIERFNEENIENWSLRWRSDSAEVDWLEHSLCYHEAVGIIEDNTLNVWDPLDQKQVTPPSTGGYGEVFFLRICEPMSLEQTDIVQWGNNSIDVGEWIDCSDLLRDRQSTCISL